MSSETLSARLVEIEAMLDRSRRRFEEGSRLVEEAHQSLAEVQQLLIGSGALPVGGRPLSYSFWRRFAEIENVAAVKVAPFNRYQTLDVVRAVAEPVRRPIAQQTVISFPKMMALKSGT